MRIPSGTVDQYVYFVAVDATDLTTRETGLSSFTVYRSRDGGTAAAFTTPTINETDATNMPGVYELLLDEDMTIGSGNASEEMVFHITATGMAPVTRVIELYDPDFELKRDLSAVSGESSRSPINALRFLRNKWSVSGTTLTVTKEDDSTSAWTATITATPGADPVTAVDPA